MAPSTPWAHGITSKLGSMALELLTEWFVSLRNATGMLYVVVTSLSEPPSKASWPPSLGFGASASISAEMVRRSQTHTHRRGGDTPNPNPRGGWGVACDAARGGPTRPGTYMCAKSAWSSPPTTKWAAGAAALMTQSVSFWQAKMVKACELGCDSDYHTLMRRKHYSRVKWQLPHVKMTESVLCMAIGGGVETLSPQDQKHSPNNSLHPGPNVEARSKELDPITTHKTALKQHCIV